MKKSFKYALLFVAASALTTGFTSCGSSNDDPAPINLQAEQNTAIKALTNTYLEAVVYPTYTNLATSPVHRRAARRSSSRFVTTVARWWRR